MQVSLAIDIAMKKKESTEELWGKLERDQYMSSAVKEVYESVRVLLTSLLSTDDMKW